MCLKVSFFYYKHSDVSCRILRLSMWKCLFTGINILFYNPLHNKIANLNYKIFVKQYYENSPTAILPNNTKATAISLQHGLWTRRVMPYSQKLFNEPYPKSTLSNFWHWWNFYGLFVLSVPKRKILVYYSVRKVWDLIFFAKTWWISIKRTCTRRPWTFIRMREFSALSIAPAYGQQHLSEVVFSALVGFSL